MDLQAVPEASKPDKQALQKCHKASVKAHPGEMGESQRLWQEGFFLSQAGDENHHAHMLRAVLWHYCAI